MIGVSKKIDHATKSPERSGSSLEHQRGSRARDRRSEPRPRATAYTAAGDRNFPATLILPQVAPSDAVWVSFSTQPQPIGNRRHDPREPVYRNLQQNDHGAAWHPVARWA